MILWFCEMTWWPLTSQPQLLWKNKFIVLLFSKSYGICHPSRMEKVCFSVVMSKAVHWLVIGASCRPNNVKVPVEVNPNIDFSLKFANIQQNPHHSFSGAARGSINSTVWFFSPGPPEEVGFGGATFIQFLSSEFMATLTVGCLRRQDVYQQDNWDAHIFLRVNPSHHPSTMFLWPVFKHPGVCGSLD